jgi:hypothetical protein
LPQASVPLIRAMRRGSPPSCAAVRSSGASWTRPSSVSHSAHSACWHRCRGSQGFASMRRRRTAVASTAPFTTSAFAT